MQKLRTLRQKNMLMCAFLQCYGRESHGKLAHPSQKCHQVGIPVDGDFIGSIAARIVLIALVRSI